LSYVTVKNCSFSIMLGLLSCLHYKKKPNNFL